MRRVRGSRSKRRRAGKDEREGRKRRSKEEKDRIAQQEGSTVHYQGGRREVLVSRNSYAASYY